MGRNPVFLAVTLALFALSACSTPSPPPPAPPPPLPPPAPLAPPAPTAERFLRYIGEEWHYFETSIVQGRVTIIGYNGTATDVRIPPSLHGLPVVGISDRAFDTGRAGGRLNSVTIPNSVTFIGERAFAGNALASVVIPDSVTYIGSEAFANNYIASLTISGGLARVGTRVFANNRLASVSIPPSVVYIGDGAFANNQLATVLNLGRVNWVWASALHGNPQFVWDGIAHGGPVTQPLPARGMLPGSRGQGIYTVQIGAFENAATARETVDALRFTTLHLEIEPSGRLHRVVVPRVRADDLADVVWRLGNAGISPDSIWIREP